MAALGGVGGWLRRAKSPGKREVISASAELKQHTHLAVISLA